MNSSNVSGLGSDEQWVWTPITWTWWLVVQLALATLGIVGNLLVIVVIVRRGRARFSSDALIGGLAFADFSTSVWMIPLPEASHLPPDDISGSLYCRVIYSNVLMWISAVASVFILTVISVERLLAVEYPFRFKRWFTARRSLLIVCLTWLGATAVNVYTLFISHYDSSSRSCTTILFPKTINTTIGVVLFLLKYLFPIVIMIGCHVAIIRSLRKQARSFQREGDAVPPVVLKLLRTTRDMTRTVLTVVIVFIICWTPDQVCFLLFNLDVYTAYLYSDISRVFVCIAFVNSCINPFIYSVKNARFRRAVVDTFCNAKQGKTSTIFLQQPNNFARKSQT